MNRIRYVLLLAIGIICSLPCNVIAAPPEDELVKYLNEIGWTKQELREHLEFYELTLDDFNTLAELREALGTPINSSNLKELLDSYNISLEEAEDILAQFGETVQDYKFIEDLDVAIDYYIHHTKDMAGLSDFLSYVGLTDDDLTALFEHLNSLNDLSLLEKTKAIKTRVEQFHNSTDMKQLSEEKRIELIHIFEELLTAYELAGKYYLIDDMDGSGKTEIEYEELRQLGSLNGKNILIELYNKNEVLLVDLALSGEMLSSDFIMQTGEQLVQVGKMAGEMNTMLYGNRLPETATNYLTLALIGFVILLGSFLFYLVHTRQKPTL